MMREPEAFRDESIEMIQATEPALERCYGELLEREQAAAETAERAAQGPYADIGPAVTQRVAALQGEVVVAFRIEKKTGRILDPRPVFAATTAPEPVVACVLASLGDLRLEPPDEREAELELAWKLGIGKRRPAR
jgi:hypothetical protein